jgi:hypothetical protein
MPLGIISKIVLGLTVIIIATLILIYMKVFIKNLENENVFNKEEMVIGRERGGGRQ